MLDPLSARGPRLERVAEVLGLAAHLPVLQLHDAHGVGRLPVVGKDEFGDPKIAAAEDAPHREALLVRLCEARLMDVAPAADALARLRILKDGVLSVDLVFHLEVVRVGRSPVEIQRGSNFAVFHLDPPRATGAPERKKAGGFTSPLPQSAHDSDHGPSAPGSLDELARMAGKAAGPWEAHDGVAEP